MDNYIYIVGGEAETCFCTLLINLVKADRQVAISPKLPTFPPLSSPNATFELAHLVQSKPFAITACTSP